MNLLYRWFIDLSLDAPVWNATTFTKTRLTLALVGGAILPFFSGSTPLGAQQRWPISVEASVGTGIGGTTGMYGDNHVGLTADALIASRIRSTRHGGVVGALSVSVQGAGPHTDECELIDDGCVPTFPEFGILSILAGLERESTGFRVLGGPVMVGPLEDLDTVALGIGARADAAGGLFGRLSALASLRGVVVPSFEGDLLGLLSVGVGLRLR